MLYIALPDNEKRILPFYLAMEEYVARHLDEDDCFFMWQVDPTVIFGRNQLIENEVNIPYCRQHGIATYRRKSGGGCVYADRGNLMISYISPSTRSQEVFEEFLAMLSSALRALGYDAVTTAHNDVLVGDRKVAGTACYTTPTGTVVHASMLYDVNLDDLQQSITPSVEKLQKHAVSSVRQRVRNLREIIDLGDIYSFRSHLETGLES
jgi:lipoic acid synthetase/lipoate-protein ligase A